MVNPIKTYITYNTHLIVGVFDDEQMVFCFVYHIVTRFCFASRSGRSLEISHGRRMLGGPSWSQGERQELGELGAEDRGAPDFP